MAIATFEYALTEMDGQGPHLSQRQRTNFAPGLTNYQRLAVTVVAGAFTAITVPVGAKFMAVILNGAVGLTLKSITGDQGIPISPTSNAITGLDLLMPLGASPSVGLASSAAVNQNVEVLFE